jgi:hypothetical protein
MEIIKNLFIGDDKAYERLKNNKGWSFLRACKEGPGGHRQILDYHTLGAPAGPNYLWVKRGNLLALNVLDLEEPGMIPDEVIDKGLKFIDDRMKAGDKVLVACNQGHSRSVGLMMLYLRSIGELPQSFARAKHIFKTIYPKADMGKGIETHVRQRWN